MNRYVRECSLTELMEDPLIDLVMKSDGVERHCIEILFDRLARARNLRGPNQRELTRCLV